MFHPNSELAMDKLRQMDEVVCDITKWKFSACAYNCTELHFDVRPGTVREEIKTLGRLSSIYRNIKGAFLDDFLTHVKHGAITVEEHSRNYAALKNANPALRFWVPVYTHELDEQGWAGFKPHLDVINLWVWSPKDLPGLDRHVERCRKIFPDSPSSWVATCGITLRRAPCPWTC